MSQTDIVFIVLDTQRADRLGCYGYDRPISPNLDRFAQQGTLFEHAVAPAQWTVPSHASMLSGLYPSAHQVLQSSQRLSNDHPHIAELLSQTGYETVGFCNNPLVGILDNGLKRGFQHFYNYGGAVPSVPHTSSSLPWPLDRLAESYTQGLRRLSYPIQNFFSRSDLAFQISLNAWTTPLWSRLANFKGQNERSVADVVTFLQDRERRQPAKPLFLFLNLMETHLPFWPPGRYVDKVAPYFRESKEARTIMRTWNREAYRWAAPLADPLGELEHRVLNDMYDAEVAYQDDYMGGLFEALRSRKRRSQTMTIIVADHGDGIGDHGYMGHAFVAYEELVHVPLIIDWPEGWADPSRVSAPVSTRRVFHTMLDASGSWSADPSRESMRQAGRLSLRRNMEGLDPEKGEALSEVFPPLNFVRAIERRQPHLLEKFQCLVDRHALVRQEDGRLYKLIQRDRKAHELYELRNDATESDNIIADEPFVTELLNRQLNVKAEEIRTRRNRQQADDIALDVDSQLAQRLRGLGYLD